MVICRTIQAMRDLRRTWRSSVEPVALVPTMGALHQGHLSLIGLAAAAPGRTVVSIFVNPTQFGPGEDFERYPRVEAEDLALCREAGVDAVFLPSAEQMYPAPSRFGVTIDGLNRHMCGPIRPGHFEGVCQVVAKLLHLVEPDTAWFGQKDIQQVAILDRFIRDYDFPVELRIGETVREPDGLALSSRNRYLSPSERAQAPELHRTLSALRDRVMDARARSAVMNPEDVEAMLRTARERLARATFHVEYLDFHDAETLAPTLHVSNGPLVLAVAARLGSTRLIDNLLIGAESFFGEIAQPGTIHSSP